MDAENPGDLLRELMAAQGASLPSLEASLADHPDPTVRLLAQLCARRAGEVAENEEGEEDSAIAARSRIRLDDRADGEPRNDLRLRREVRGLRQELERLREVNDTLAAALGACPLCWGEDAGCRICHGRGGPGSRRPDRALFTRFVAPAARRLEPAAGTRFQRRAQPPTERSRE
jgi:hypothetical protein